MASLLAAVAVATAAVQARSQNDGANAKPPVPPPYVIEVPKCAIKLMKEVILSAERPGILGAIDVEEGDTVEEGKLLAKVKDDVPLATLAIAQKEAESDIDIRYASKAAEVAQVEFEKAEAANRVKKGTVPDVEVRRAELAARKAELEIEKASHVHEVNGLKRDEANVQVKTCRIEAPFAGYVTKVHLTKGATVRQGDPVVEMVVTSKVKVEGHVSLSDALRLTPGMPVTVEVLLNEEKAKRDGEKQSPKVHKTVKGVLRYVDVKATSGDNRVRIWAEIPNEEQHLIAGLNAIMKIELPANVAPKPPADDQKDDK